MAKNDGRTIKIKHFAAVVANVMSEMDISLDRLKDSTKKRTPNGFPEAVAKALNAEKGQSGPATWTNSYVSKCYKMWQGDGSLFPAIEEALHAKQSAGGEHSEQNEQTVNDPKQKAAADYSPHSERDDDKQLHDALQANVSEEIADTPDSELPKQASNQLDRDDPKEWSAHSEQKATETIDVVTDKCSECSEGLQLYESDAVAENNDPSSVTGRQTDNEGPADIPENMKAAIRVLAKEVFQELVGSAPNVHSVPKLDDAMFPPEPQELENTGKGGRRQIREYQKLSATVDSVLFDRFRSECKDRKLSAGRMLDAILWNWYGRPELSYQREDAETRARERPKR